MTRSALRGVSLSEPPVPVHIFSAPNVAPKIFTNGMPLMFMLYLPGPTSRVHEMKTVDLPGDRCSDLLGTQSFRVARVLIPVWLGRFLMLGWHNRLHSSSGELPGVDMV